MLPATPKSNNQPLQQPQGQQRLPIIYKEKERSLKKLRKKKERKKGEKQENDQIHPVTAKRKRKKQKPRTSLKFPKTPLFFLFMQRRRKKQKGQWKKTKNCADKQQSNCDVKQCEWGKMTSIRMATASDH